MDQKLSLEQFLDGLRFFFFFFETERMTKIKLINQPLNFSNLKLSILPVVDSLSFENFEVSILGQ